MANPRITKFDIPGLFLCPLCRQPLRFHTGSLLCKKGHCFDVSSRGYVNLIPAQKQMKGYDKAFFAHRRVLLDAGYYAHILGGIQQALLALPQGARIGDIGCGEGYYAKNLTLPPQAEMLGIDLSKDAIALAAAGGNPVLWMTADLARLPLSDGSMDCLLNIFTPANYSEFCRVLRPGGLVLKVVPGSGHLQELRVALKEHLRREEYSNAQVVNGFTAQFELLDRIPLSRTFAPDEAQLHTLLGMTPLAFGIPQEILDNCRVDTVTIEAELLIGRKQA